MASEFQRKTLSFGGSLLNGNNPKTSRPLDSKLPVHLVLRSQRARGTWSLRRGLRQKQVREIVYRTAKKYGVKIHEYANAGNHLHILLKLHKRFLWKSFICELTGRLAMCVRVAAKNFLGNVEIGHNNDTVVSAAAHAFELKAGQVDTLDTKLSQSTLQQANEAKKILKGKFWDSRPYTRLVTGWNKAFSIANDYVALNMLETLGILSRKEKMWRSDLHAILELG